MATISQIQVGDTDYDILDAKSIQWKNPEKLSPISVSDLNTIQDSGYYSISKANNANNFPTDGSNSGILIVYHDRNDSNLPIITQTYYATSSKIFSRIRSSNGTTTNWGPWMELAAFPSSVTMSLQGLIFTGIDAGETVGKFFLGSIPNVYGRQVDNITITSNTTKAKVFWWKDLSDKDKYLDEVEHTIAKIDFYQDSKSDINLGIRIFAHSSIVSPTTGHLYRVTDTPPSKTWKPTYDTTEAGFPTITINYKKS